MQGKINYLAPLFYKNEKRKKMISNEEFDLLSIAIIASIKKEMMYLGLISPIDSLKIEQSLLSNNVVCDSSASKKDPKRKLDLPAGKELTRLFMKLLKTKGTFNSSTLKNEIIALKNEEIGKDTLKVCKNDLVEKGIMFTKIVNVNGNDTVIYSSTPSFGDKYPTPKEELSNICTSTPIKRKMAKDIMLEFLSEGPKSGTLLNSRILSAGFSSGTISDTKKELIDSGLVSFKPKGNGVIWRLVSQLQDIDEIGNK